MARSGSLRAVCALVVSLVVGGAALAQQTCILWTASVTDPLTGSQVSGSPHSTQDAACAEGGSLYASKNSFPSGTATVTMTGSASMVNGLCTFSGTRTVTTQGNPPSIASWGAQIPLNQSSGPCPQQCPPPGTVAGDASTVWHSERSVAQTGLDFCNSGCLYTASMGAGASDGTGGTYFSGPSTASGGPCTDSAQMPAATPSQLPPGRCPGTVNGTAVPGGVPCDKTWSAPKKDQTTTETKNQDGSTQSKSETGSSKQAVCNATTCTITTTTTTINNNGAGGTTTGTSTETTTKAKYCAENKADAQCAGGPDSESAFGGSCGGFSCSGDAVQCAMAQEQHRRNCAMFDTATTISDIGTNAATGQNPQDHPKNAPENIAIDLSTKLSSTPLFGASGQCPTDVQFSHAGFAFSLPFSKWCPYLQLLGAAVMAAAYLSAGFIVFRKG